MHYSVVSICTLLQISTTSCIHFYICKIQMVHVVDGNEHVNEKHMLITCVEHV